MKLRSSCIVDNRYISFEFEAESIAKVSAWFFENYVGKITLLSIFQVKEFDGKHKIFVV